MKVQLAIDAIDQLKKENININEQIGKISKTNPNSLEIEQLNNQYRENALIIKKILDSEIYF